MKRPSAASKEDPKEDTKKKKKRAEEPEPAEPAEPEKKKKKAAHPKEPAEPEKKVRAKPGEASSFARRPCPSTSPAKTRWLAIRNTYKNDVEKQVEDAGGNARAWEDCFWSWMLRLNSILGVFVHKKKGLGFVLGCVSFIWIGSMIPYWSQKPFSLGILVDALHGNLQGNARRS